MATPQPAVFNLIADSFSQGHRSLFCANFNFTIMLHTKNNEIAEMKRQNVAKRRQLEKELHLKEKMRKKAYNDKRSSSRFDAQNRP